MTMKISTCNYQKFNHYFRMIFVLSLILFIPFSIMAQEETKLPDLAQSGQNGYLKGNLIYSLDNRPTPECHASTIEETPSGMVAAWFGGTEEKDPDVGIWTSHLVDGKWTDPVEVVNGIQHADLRYPCWNPVLFYPDKGPLMLFYKVGPSPREWWGEVMTSEDDGHTWSAPRKLGDGRLGPLLGPIKNKPVQLSDGTILCPSSIEVIKEGEVFWQVHFELSNDLGKTWEVIGPINDGVEFDAIQPSILFYENNKMQILCRTRQNVVSESWSTDGGRTWSNMTATSLPNPSAGTDAVTLSDGRQLLVYNHTRGGRSSRRLLNVAISGDGKSWDTVMTLENQKGEYSYPAVIQASNGLVHITYTYDRHSVKHVVLDPVHLK